ncbi:MAG: amidohydrolase family protein, partial [Candidatus Ornithospirochaeta sp.]
MTVKGRVGVDGILRSAEIVFEGGIITEIRECSEENLPLVMPGFIDVHTHGGGGMDVNHIESVEDVEKLSLFYASHGVTSVQLSLVTDTEENMTRLCRILGEAAERELPGADLIGIHLEGPFLSDEYKGSMPASLIVDPDVELFNRYYEAGKGHITYSTLAPAR